MPKLTLGPGAMVAAAFIGPGTVTTAAVAGASMGMSLVWAVGFSLVATLVLQELAVRCALASHRDLSALLREVGMGRWWGPGLILLVVLAIGVGNSAYQSGNLAGASLGLQAALGGNAAAWTSVSAVIAALLIVIDRYPLLEGVLVSLVIIMAVLFCGLALLLAPDLTSQSDLRTTFAAPTERTALVLALIGTTVVPYNLFLHATAARRRWHGEPTALALSQARGEAFVSILIGGVVTIAVLTVAAAALLPNEAPSAIASLIIAIEGALPGWGSKLVGIGLFAAGLTSAIAAPISAGWAVCGAMGWPADHRSRASRIIALTVLVIGTSFAVAIERPVSLIIFAQMTNAILLPVVGGSLLLVANRSKTLAGFHNGHAANVAAGGVILVVMILALAKLGKIIGL